MPVVDLFELLLDDVSDEQDLASAQKVGDARKWSVAGTNTIVIPLMTPGMSQREDNLRERSGIYLPPDPLAAWITLKSTLMRLL